MDQKLSAGNPADKPEKADFTVSQEKTVNTSRTEEALCLGPRVSTRDSDYKAASLPGHSTQGLAAATAVQVQKSQKRHTTAEAKAGAPTTALSQGAIYCKKMHMCMDTRHPDPGTDPRTRWVPTEPASLWIFHSYKRQLETQASPRFYDRGCKSGPRGALNTPRARVPAPGLLV